MSGRNGFESALTWRWPVSIAAWALAAAQAALSLGLGLSALSDARIVGDAQSGLSQRDVFGIAARQRTEASLANVFMVGTAVFAVAGLLVAAFAPSGDR